MSSLTTILSQVAADVALERDELNRLDAVAGDGDIGITIASGAQALQALLPGLADDDLATVLKRCGSELARKVPSTSGTLVATGFLRAGRAAGDAMPEPTQQLAHCIEAALQSMRERGKAAPGEKTMLDALAPAAAAIRTAVIEGADVATALRHAATAAAAGADATKQMRAKVGRAGWLADRSEGHEDAGAHMVAAIFASAARHMAG